MMKEFLAIVSGLVAAFLFVLITTYIAGAVYMPEGTDINDHKALHDFLPTAPKRLFLIEMTGFALAAFTGSFVTVLISGSVRDGLAVTLIFFMVIVMNYFSLPHPTWAIFGGSAFVLIGGYVGTRFLKPKAA